MNTTTKRFPRTLCEAFGPYTSTRVEEPARRASARHQALYLVLLCLALVGAFLVALAGVL